MAALRPCPSGHVVVQVARRLPIVISRPSSSLRTVPALGGGGTAAPRLRHRHAIAAQRGGADYWPFGVEPGDTRMTDEQLKKFDDELKKHHELDEDMSFQEEIKTICEYWEKMTSSSCNTCIFDMEATALSLHLCMVVTKGVKLASRVKDSAALRLDKQGDKPGEFYLHTTKQALNMYVSIFVKLAEDTYHKNFNDKSIFSLLGALRGVAAIGHILVKDALESVDHVEYGSLNYSSLVQDTDDSWHEFEQNINNLEHKFRAVLKSNSKKYELLRPTIEEAVALTIFFISQVVTKHERVLGYIPSTKGRRATKASYEEGLDGSKVG